MNIRDLTIDEINAMRENGELKEKVTEELDHLINLHASIQEAQSNLNMLAGKASTQKGDIGYLISHLFQDIEGTFLHNNHCVTWSYEDDVATIDMQKVQPLSEL